MQLPYRLLRRRDAEAATALLLLSHDAAELLALCAELAHDPPPKTYLTAYGFLLLLDAPTAKHWPQTIRLRRLADFLLLPVDAELSPQLHDEEAAALTRERGLVFLPGERVLEFASESPIETTALLAAGSVRRDGWTELPPAREFPEHLSITLELPLDDPGDVVDGGGDGIGTEDPTPSGDAGPLETAKNRAKLGLGKAMARLGRALGLDALRRAGERMVQSAADAVPQLAQGLYGAQGAALRELLKMFRSGDLEKALKRAIPKGDAEGYRGRTSGGTRLPWHNLNYSLGNILGGGGGGPADIWMGHDDVVAELFREYRRAAEEASNRGDYRRAAFIYGKLLADWSAAADVLARGALHHDAAILYRDKLNNPLRAASQFELAGEFDVALAIYDKQHQHELAGDLLLRLGEEDDAFGRYRWAADEMMKTGRGALRAGEFIQKKTGRDDLAEPYFAAGWSLRKSTTMFGDVVPCGTHLARIFAKREKPEPFLNLLGEAEGYFAPGGNAQAAGQMFNELATLSSQPSFEESRDEIRDRCLLALAGKLREHAAVEERPGTIVSTLLGCVGVWEAPVVRDSSFALKASLQKPNRDEPAERPANIVHLGNGTVTAARVAPHTGEVFVGFDDGRVVCYRASANRVQLVGYCPSTIAALATTLDGSLAVMSILGQAGVELRAFHRAAGQEFRASGMTVIEDCPRPTGLAPLIADDGNGVLFTYVRYGPAPTDIAVFRDADLLAVNTGPVDVADEWPIDLPLPKEVPGHVGTSILILQKGEVSLYGMRRDAVLDGMQIGRGARVDWAPSLPPGSTLLKPPATWHQHAADRIEVAGLNEEGAIYWLDLKLSAMAVSAARVLATGTREGFRAVKLVKPGVLAGVTRQNRVIWLRATGDRLAEWSTPQKLPAAAPAVGAFYCLPTNELLVVLSNGSLVRVSIPT